MTYFNRLYLGFEAEYFVVSRLFAAGFETFKLPGDFGFDLIVGNIKERTFGGSSTSPAGRFPHFIQVKSRRLKRTAFREGPSGRPEADAKFNITPTGWNRLIQEDMASLVSVLFYQHPSHASQSMAAAFWLPAGQLDDLEQRGYFHEKQTTGDREFIVRIRLMPTQERDALLESLVDNGDLTQSGRERLEQQLPAALPLQWRASPYLSLLRPDRSGAPGWIARQLIGTLTDLANVGTSVNVLNSLD